MKVLLLNGSPREKGCTFTALTEVANTLNQDGIETEIVWIGNKAVQGCIACLVCRKGEKKECPFDDGVKVFAEKAKVADGLIFGSPVYYAGSNGTLHAFMDRLFFANSTHFKGKPAACVVSARRSGTTATVDNLNKYFLISQMPIVSANYWNAVHGSCPEDVQKDIEGLQTMRTIGRNMAWLLKTIDKAKIPFPEGEKKIYTNFIR
ncbi:MAG: flavodoxin family protein [Firmicutes bacterium]|nr:flavodoxin family protein [Bacillota bacterium]MCL2255553.1 flavodoxin family protein [Bacillota bacterium]